MNRVIGHAIVISFLGLSLPSQVSADGEKIMVFKDPEPYEQHAAAIKAGMALLREFAAANKFSIDTTVSFSSFNSTNLAKYDAVALMSPMRKGAIPDTLSPSQDSALQSFLRSGKGLMGFHDIDRFCNNWDWFHKLIGVQWLGDVGPKNLTFHVVDTSHPMTKGIPKTFISSQQPRYEKLFFSDTSKGWTVLIEGDDKDYPSTKKQPFYPFVFIHDFEGARMWYGMMGHTAPTYSDTIWRKLVLNGIFYAINRSGYVRCADPISRPMFRNTAEWTITQGRERDPIVRIFDFTGRTIGVMPRSSLQQGIMRHNIVKLPFGPYIVALNNTNRSPAVLWIPQIRQP
jgi:type 1 glutamine amidotransferase